MGWHPLEPGYAKVLVAPQPGGGITWAKTALQTRHGRVAVSWTTEGGDGFSLDVELPEGVSALVRLPDGTEREIGSGSHSLAGAAAEA